MTRVAELMKGKRFTPETAFHMETTLGLPHGFFDQPNPALADETIARLKSLLDFVQIDEGFDAGYEALARASASGFDIADRPNGKKRIDSVEASRFTERLGLPQLAGWTTRAPKARFQSPCRTCLHPVHVVGHPFSNTSRLP